MVVLRQPGKPDNSLPCAYRAISLLNTLGKLLDAVTTRRLSFTENTNSCRTLNLEDVRGEPPTKRCWC
jgi:hypothetical protein